MHLRFTHDTCLVVQSETSRNLYKIPTRGGNRLTASDFSHWAAPPYDGHKRHDNGSPGPKHCMFLHAKQVKKRY